MLRRRRRGRARRAEPPVPTPAADADAHADADADAPAGALPPPPLIVDARTRTFWSRAGSAETLVEAPHAPPAGAGAAGRAAARRRDGAANPAGDPVHLERVFVELMRLGRHERAFALLAEPCRKAWGSAARFGAEQEAAPGAALDDVRVWASRRLDRWQDPDTGTVSTDVAELDVEYALTTRRGPIRLRRRVHLVGSGGRWRLLCWPPGGDRAAPW